MLLPARDVAHLLCCPRCRSRLDQFANGQLNFVCSNAQCELSLRPFFVVDGQPILVDFASSVLEEESFAKRSGISLQKRDPLRRSIKSRLKQILLGDNKIAQRISVRFNTDSCRLSEEPLILIIGGGELGSGASALYINKRVRVIGSDIYVSPNTTLVADGHNLPFPDQSLDGVWIQAVLEHVLDPNKVVAEIHRVLKPGGIVFADTPFMQQVHEGAYDFTRFTLSGHRWLFRNFDLIEAGYTGGPGTGLHWSIRYFVRAITKNEKIGKLAGFAFIWLRFFDRRPTGRNSADASSGVFFYGRRAEQPIGPKQIITFYEEQKEMIRSAGPGQPT